MIRLQRNRRALCHATPAIVAAILAACGGDQAAGTDAAPDARAPAKRSAVRTQAIVEPCAWIAAANVEAVLGKLAAPPRLGRNASNPRADEAGAACVYSFPGRNGATAEVAVQIDPTGATAQEQASDMLTGMFTRELSDGAQRTAPTSAPRADGWDYVGGLSEARVWRVGHLAVAIGGSGTFLVTAQKLNELAAALRDRIPDVPFADPGADPSAVVHAPDPCSLLTSAEAEAVLGKLAVEPFRSSETTPLADADGRSCTYYTHAHHAFVLTPTRSDGKTMFGMVSGTSGIMRSLVGGADTADALDGPWDQAAEGPAGSMFFLKDDQMLEVSYRASATDVRGAARLAGLAIGRLSAGE